MNKIKFFPPPGIPAWHMIASQLNLQSNDSSKMMFVGLLPLVSEVVRAKKLRAQLLKDGVQKSDIKFILFSFGIRNELMADLIEVELGPLYHTVELSLPHLIAADNSDSSYVNPFLNKLISKMVQEKSNDDPELTDLNTLEKKIEKKIWSLTTRLKGDAQVEAVINQALEEELEKINRIPPREDLNLLLERIKDHLLGLGPLEKLTKDANINEIMVNGVDQIFIEKNGKIEKTSAHFQNENQLRTVIDRIVTQGGRHVDHASPLCNVTLKDGSRANVVLPPLALKGPSLTIRRFRPMAFTFDDLKRNGTIEKKQIDQLTSLIHAKKNIVVAGNSGSGKTTLLNLLSTEFDQEERIITLEDTAELKIHKPHVVSFQTREANAEGEGEITLDDLVINALRMRPDRLIVGECRGREIIPMLQAMNTGHKGSMTTLHANSAEDVMSRLESMVLSAMPRWPVSVVHKMIMSALDVIIYLERNGNHRKLIHIKEVNL